MRRAERRHLPVMAQLMLLLALLLIAFTLAVGLLYNWLMRRQSIAHCTPRGDYARLRQMLLAVVDNAVKFTPPGKAIRIALRPDAPVITVEDEGEGIAPDELAHIFDRFHHTRDASRQSTGLGLTIVQEIARRHGVTLCVQSTPGAGTTFTFAFPTDAKHG